MNRLLVVLSFSLASLAFASPVKVVFECQSAKGYSIQVLKGARGKTAVVKRGETEVVRYSVVASQGSDRYEFLDSQTNGGNFTLRVAYSPDAGGQTLAGFFLAAEPKGGMCAAEITCRFK